MIAIGIEEGWFVPVYTTCYVECNLACNLVNEFTCKSTSFVRADGKHVGKLRVMEASDQADAGIQNNFRILRENCGKYNEKLKEAVETLWRKEILEVADSWKMAEKLGELASR
eukprot:m.28000 g.28000  ORF g.28000 m.28000 type:complete len:113 (+) comp30526_c0_seq1:639-977(+)